MKWTRTEATNRNILATLALTAAATIGASVGYAVAYKIQERKFEESLGQELEKAKILYQEMYSTPVMVMAPESDDQDDVRIDSLEQRIREASEEIDGMPDDAVSRAISAARTYSAEEMAVIKETAEEKPEPEIINMFDHHTPPGEEVLAALMADRDPAAPYIITKEEFLENEPDFEQKSFTFYEGDSILVDDQDEYSPIQMTQQVVGDENLMRFGYGSGDEYVLYVRNEALDPPLDLHITRSTGKYSVEVMALDDTEPHLQHARPQKFRLRDE